jgi:hypothetical protein
MFILPDGRPISPDVPFELGDVSYPANWLRLATPEERDAIGITEVPDPAPYDQRFYWGPGLPKDHTQLVEQWTAQTRTTAGTLLAPTDWMVVRKVDNGTEIPIDWQLWRETVRMAVGTKVTAIAATASTDELAAYITGADYPTWPSDPSQPMPEIPVMSAGVSSDLGIN